jgi:hypothetical protein
MREQFLSDFVVLPEYITEKEQDELMVEVERAVKKKRYLAEHFDKVISGYKEIQRSEWVRFDPIASSFDFEPQC